MHSYDGFVMVDYVTMSVGEHFIYDAKLDSGTQYHHCTTHQPSNASMSTSNEALSDFLSFFFLF